VVCSLFPQLIGSAPARRAEEKWAPFVQALNRVLMLIRQGIAFKLRRRLTAHPILARETESGE
jgi:hypothetical protein